MVAGCLGYLLRGHRGPDAREDRHLPGPPSGAHNPTAIRRRVGVPYDRWVPGSDDELMLDDLFADAELGEITKPEHRHASEPGLALGSDIYAAPRAERDQRPRAPLDGIDAVLVAYLMDLDVPALRADRRASNPDETGPSVGGVVDELDSAGQTARDP